MSAHSNIGPSGAKRWMNCPGSVTLEKSAPRIPTSKYAAEGTVAHGLAEEYTLGKATYEQLRERIGSIVKCEGHEIEVTDEMVDAAVAYGDAIKADADALRATKGSAAVEILIEKRVCASSVDPDLWGTADCIIYKKGKKLIIRDFKYGKGVSVNVEGNEQASIYAIAVMDTIECWAFDEVELIIDQPRAGGESRWTTTPAALKELRDELVDKVAQTKDPLAPVMAGDWCRWCRARPVCPAASKAVQAAAQADFDVVPPVPAGKNEAERMMARLPEVRLLPVAQLVKALQWEDAASSFFEAVRAVLNERLTAGEDIPGVKLVEGRSLRQWRSEDEVKAEFQPLFGDKVYAPRKLLSPAQLEKVVGKGKVDHLTVKPAGKLTVALFDDRRPAVASAAKTDFAVIEQKPGAPAAAPTAPCVKCCPVMGPCDEHVDGKKAAPVKDPLLAELVGEKRPPIWPQ